MVTKVSPNYVGKVADRIAGAIVDHAYELKKNPKIRVDVTINDSFCLIVVYSSCHIGESVVKEIVKRISGIENVKYDFTLIDGYNKDFSCSENVSVKARIEGDNDRRVVSVCNDIFNHTDDQVCCEFEYPNMTIRTSKKIDLDKVDFCVNHNDISMKVVSDDFNPKSSMSNTSTVSDMGMIVTYLHGRDVFNPHVSLAIYAYLLAEKKGGEVCISCKKGDTIVNGVKYTSIVNKVKKYINGVGGFEKLAEWGMYRPLVRN